MHTQIFSHASRHCFQVCSPWALSRRASTDWKLPKINAARASIRFIAFVFCFVFYFRSLKDQPTRLGYSPVYLCCCHRSSYFSNFVREGWSSLFILEARLSSRRLRTGCGACLDLPIPGCESKGSTRFPFYLVRYTVFSRRKPAVLLESASFVRNFKYKPSVCVTEKSLVKLYAWKVAIFRSSVLQSLIRPFFFY